jgi:hypothetical protein
MSLIKITMTIWTDLLASCRLGQSLVEEGADDGGATTALVRGEKVPGETIVGDEGIG